MNEDKNNDNLEEVNIEETARVEEVIETPIIEKSNVMEVDKVVNNETANTVHSQEKPKSNGLTIAALILSIVSLFAWPLAILGYLTSIPGLVLALVGRKTCKNGVNITAIILSILGILASIMSSIIGVLTYLAIMS